MSQFHTESPLFFFFFFFSLPLYQHLLFIAPLLQWRSLVQYVPQKHRPLLTTSLQPSPTAVCTERMEPELSQTGRRRTQWHTQRHTHKSWAPTRKCMDTHTAMHSRTQLTRLRTRSDKDTRVVLNVESDILTETWREVTRDILQTTDEKFRTRTPLMSISYMLTSTEWCSGGWRPLEGQQFLRENAHGKVCGGFHCWAFKKLMFVYGTQHRQLSSYVLYIFGGLLTLNYITGDSRLNVTVSCIYSRGWKMKSFSHTDLAAIQQRSSNQISTVVYQPRRVFQSLLWGYSW